MEGGGDTTTTAASRLLSPTSPAEFPEKPASASEPSASDLSTPTTTAAAATGTAPVPAPTDDLFDDDDFFGGGGMYPLGEDEALSDELLRRTDRKPFAGFGSYRHRYGGAPDSPSPMSPAEAPAKLETTSSNGGGGPPLTRPARHQRRLRRPKSLTNVLARDEAWERRSQQVMMEEMEAAEEDSRARAIGRSVSDCGDRSWPRPSSARARTRSLTDDDLAELRGCIDLGFGFSNDREDPDLCNTLPALELCYAISRSYDSRSSPVSTLDGGGGGGPGSLTNSPKHSWTISSPGKCCPCL